jgi:hypothetical protein
VSHCHWAPQKDIFISLPLHSLTQLLQERDPTQTAFIAQQNIYNYNEDIAVLDLIAGNQEDILVSLGIPLPKFLAAYKAAHKPQGISTPTINFNF